MKKFLVAILALLAFVTVSAQPPFGHGGPHGGPHGGDRSARMIEMLQKSLDMTPEQAKKFAPVYQGYMRELRQVRKDTKMIVDSYKADEMTVKVAKKIMLAQLNGEKQIIQVKKEYIQVFVNHLTPEQLAKVFTLGQGPRGPRGPRGLHGGQGALQGAPQGAPQGGK
jgi:Spy/CpxP family protein refolding chaperone